LEKRIRLIIIISVVLFLILAVSLMMNLDVLLWFSDHAGSSYQRADAVILVNSSSEGFADFGHFIKPYLEHFGVPYDLIDISAQNMEGDISDYALIIIGHRQLDPTGIHLIRNDVKKIDGAVQSGTGLVNFDYELPGDVNQPYPQLIEDVNHITILPTRRGSGVEFLDLSGDVRVQINCWEDSHQDPVLNTTSDVDNLHDDAWIEFFDSSIRTYPTIMSVEAGENNDMPVMSCFADEIPDGDYKVFANLYTGESQREMRYYFGFNADEPKEKYVDTMGGIGGGDLHEEYKLGKVMIEDGSFEVYFNDVDLISGNDRLFGWSWIRLVPVQESPSEMHWITDRHESGEVINTGQMKLAGFNPQDDVTILAVSDSHPILTVTDHGLGRAVQWGSYEWISHDVKGPLYGMDDLFWRSLVWAARKPFVMQGLPPFLTLRVDDVSGPFDWIHTANEFGIKPWVGLFFNDIDKNEAADLSALVIGGNATASIHAFDDRFFYFNHDGGDWSDEVIEENYKKGTQWHNQNNIPISKVVFPHFYEIGTNGFQGLSEWGVEFVGLQAEPGTSYGSSWIKNGPYREFENGVSSSSTPLYYADYITVPGHPEFDNEFFNCVTEIRDDAGYEWYPDNDINGSIGRGTRQLTRAFDSMALGTLFTHGKYVDAIDQENWRAILNGIIVNTASNNPGFVTLDYACQYVRSVNTSEIMSGQFDLDTGILRTQFDGKTDLTTQFFVFTEDGGDMQAFMVDVPVFDGTINIEQVIR